MSHISYIIVTRGTVVLQLQTHVDGAAHERAPAQGLLDDVEEVGAGLEQLMDLCDASGEVLKALSGGAPREGLIAAIHPAHTQTHARTHTHTHSLSSIMVLFLWCKA